ncbi:sensor histidine kinase [Micromonospora sp. DT229]|uniref:sensor histidine kinase n=1 Tax=Micromonospora sp. DT229 TaxID=3393430 RepID=UPI003CF79C03
MVDAGTAPHPDNATTGVAVRTAQTLVFLLSIAYLSIPASRVITTQPVPQAGLALLALIGVALLQFRHTWHGLRAQPPVTWSWTLLLQAILSYAPAPLAGDAWLGVPSFLAASLLITLRAPLAYVAYLGVVVAEIPFALLVHEDPSDIAYATLGVALTGAVVFGFVKMATLVWEVHRLRATLAHRAVDIERLRFARDLHDVLGHQLCAIALKGELASAVLRTRPETAEREIAELIGLAREAHRDIREVVAGYRTVSLAGEMTGVTSVLTSAGIQCEVDTVPLETLPPETATPLAFALREGATNVLRHSTARHCSITLRAQDEGLRLRIVNDGVPPGPSHGGGNGLEGLRERLHDLDGHLNAGPVGAGSFELTVYVPSTVTEAAMVEATR